MKIVKLKTSKRGKRRERYEKILMKIVIFEDIKKKGKRRGE